MSNHSHLVVTPSFENSMPNMMRLLSGRYAQYFNAKYERSGPLWDGRYRSVPIQTDSHFFVCQRYVELNPVRAHIVHHPGDYEWSSYRGNAGISTDSVVSPHELYEGLAKSPNGRRQAYQRLFEDVVPDEAARIFNATMKGRPIGSDRFLKSLELAVGSRIKPRPRGRPKKGV